MLQSDPSVGLRILIRGLRRPLLSFNVLMVDNPISMNCGVWVWTVSAADFILQSKYMSLLELSESLWPITLLKIDAESRSSGKFPSMTASSFGVSPTNAGEVDSVYLQPAGSYWGHRVGMWQLFQSGLGREIQIRLQHETFLLGCFRWPPSVLLSAESR